MALLRIEFNQKAGSEGKLSIQIDGIGQDSCLLKNVVKKLSGCPDVVRILGLQRESVSMPENPEDFEVFIKGTKTTYNFPACTSIFDYAAEIKKAARQIRFDAEIAYPEINEAVELEV